ncbi:MAG: 50S ribosomal protein L24 [Candidatus Margulisbacteria bacterium]|nr:50S ribosomal protein L24 [Candidatus Margulisiibacteriota bacterium]
MNKLKKNDEVVVIAGKNKGLKSKVLQVLPAKSKVLVEKANIVKKHQKPSYSGPGGIVEMEKPIDISNVMVVCKYCKKPTRLSIEEVKGKLVRKCKKCNEIIDK